MEHMNYVDLIEEVSETPANHGVGKPATFRDLHTEPIASYF